MKPVYKLLLFISFLIASFNCFAQFFRFTDTDVKPADMPPNFIGAELPADKKYYYKAANGADSVILASYTIYYYGKKRVYTLDGTMSTAKKPPHFKGTVEDGKMQHGALYFEDAFYNNEYVYIGGFADNKADGPGIYRVTSRQIGVSPKECKAFFQNGCISERGLMKMDFDSTGAPTLYYSGGIKLGYGNEIVITDGYGSFFCTDYVRPAYDFYKPVLNKAYGVGVPGAYYEGQIIDGLRTGFGLYNVFDYATKTTSNFKVGLLAADFPVTQFSILPINMSLPDKVDKKNEGLNALFPEIESATGASFIYNGRSYSGMQLNKKPYGFGLMMDADGFFEIGFWKNGTRVFTDELLKYLLPDSAMLNMHPVTNKAIRVTTKYDAKKNKYVEEKESITATVTYYGKLNAEGKIEGWGVRNGGFVTEAGYFLPVKLVSDKKLEMPKAAEIFNTAYAVKYGNGSGNGYGVQNEQNRFYTRSGFYASRIVPYGEISLGFRDANTIALCEYRDKRNYEVAGWQAYVAIEAEKNKKKEAEKQQAFDALFLHVTSPSHAEIRGCIGNFFLDRTGRVLYKVTNVDAAMKNFQVEVRPVDQFNSNFISVPVNQLFGSGNFRQVQKYVTCRSCGGTGTINTSYSYTADYEYTYGVKVKSTYSKSTYCSCGCGLEPEQFGAKRDW